MSWSARILYEDQQDVGSVFGPHQLVLACVADRCGGTAFELHREFDVRPLKGAEKVIRALRQPERGRLTRDGVPLFALIDGDQLWRPLHLPREATDDQLAQAIFGGPPPESVSLFILRENLETVCQAVLDCGFTGSSWSPDLRAKPSLTERDKLLVRAAESWTSHGRACVMSRVPAFGALVDALVAAATA